MKRTTFERPETSETHSATASRARANHANVTNSPAPAQTLPPVMSEKQNLLARLGSRKEIAAGEFSVRLGNIGSDWQLPLDVTVKIASELRSSAEWKGMTLASRQGYLSVDTAHPGRRFLGLKAELPNLCPGNSKVAAVDIHKFLDKLAPDSIYSRAFLTVLSTELTLVTNLALFCWCEHKVYAKDRPSLMASIINNLEAFKNSRDAKNFEDNVRAALPLLRSGTRKITTTKCETHFELRQLKSLYEKGILSHPEAFLIEIQKALFKYHGSSRTSKTGDELIFKKNAIRNLEMADLATLAALDDGMALSELIDRLKAMPIEKRLESVCKILHSIQIALEQGHFSILLLGETLLSITGLVQKCIDLMEGSSFDDKLMQASINTISSTCQYTEKLWNTSPGADRDKFLAAKHMLRGLSRHISQWITTLTPPEAALALKKLPAVFLEILKHSKN